MAKQSRNLITVVLTVFLIVAFFSTNVFAARTTVSVTNETPYPLRAVYKAVGCVQFLSGSADGNETSDGTTIHNQTPEVCAAKYVAPGETVSYEFGGGTSGRKVWAEIYSATPEMLILAGLHDSMFQAAWNSAYVGNSAIVKDSWSWGYDLYDDKSNSCAVKGFGILHDAHVVWTKIEVHEDCAYDCDEPLFKADCGAVVSQSEAVEPEEFALFLELNSTDGDLGLHGFLDVDAWRRVRVINPNGFNILEIEPNRHLKRLGLTEISFESEEPLLEEQDILKRFREGVYKLVGNTVDGKKFTHEAELSHGLPAAPVILNPAEGDELDPNEPVTIEWTEGTGGETHVAFWEFELEKNGVQVLSTVLDRETTFYNILPYIEQDSLYKAEVIAVGLNGNKTITETSFTTTE